MSTDIEIQKPSETELANAQALIEEFNAKVSTQSNMDDICKYLSENKTYTDAASVLSSAFNIPLGIALKAIFAALTVACEARKANPTM